MTPHCRQKMQNQVTWKFGENVAYWEWQNP